MVSGLGGLDVGHEELECFVHGGNYGLVLSIQSVDFFVVISHQKHGWCHDISQRKQLLVVRSELCRRPPIEGSSTFPGTRQRCRGVFSDSSKAVLSSELLNHGKIDLNTFCLERQSNGRALLLKVAGPRHQMADPPPAETRVIAKSEEGLQGPLSR